jgi:HEAT repeat protein
LPPSGAPAIRDLSPEAQAATAWFRQLARALRVFRLYRSDNPIVTGTQEAVTAELTALLEAQGGWQLRFAPTRVFLGDEPVVSASAGAAEAGTSRSVTDQVPFLFYRDGVRRITLVEGAPQAEVEAFVRILRTVSTGNDAQDDFVTLLWQANLAHVQIEAVPLEQTIYLSAETGGGPAGAADPRGQTYAVPPQGSDIRGALGQVAGAQGLHRDTFDDWALPEGAADVPEAFARLEPMAEAARRDFLVAWEQEDGAGWTTPAAEFLRGLRVLDDSEDMQRVLARSATTWLTAALRGAAWSEATQALELLNEVDPERRLGGEELAAALATLDAQEIADRFDEGDPDDLSRFAAFVVALGSPAVGLCVDVMSRAEKARARAATVTALCYLCAEDPELLAPWLLDSRWHVVRNIVFVLGHIGGSAVAPLLQAVSRHPEPRVRRQLVQALGSLSREERTPMLIDQLDTRDPQLLSAVLNVLSRERDPRTVRAILACIAAPDFESRDENNQRALFGALGEIADDDAVPPLEALLNKGGWFARRSLQRVAAARTLCRLGTPRAMAALEAAVRARGEAVRAAALEALGSRGRP